LVQAERDDGSGLPLAEPTLCALGGLFFIVQVLERLQIAQFISDHPELAPLALPQRVLRRIGERLDPTGSDPVFRVLGEPGPEMSGRTWVVPEAWRRELRAPGPCRRASLGPLAEGWCAVFDAGGLLLAWFRDEPPSELTADWGDVVAEAAQVDGGFITWLVDAWVMAIERWLAVHTELDLATLVRRPAALQCTRTHLDVVLALETADVRVRRAALDLNPGWVAWLGWVVTFHYVRGGGVSS
jgi:hypothetical protein